ncbi:MAG: rhodanese-like domain-containing protein [Rubrimonas sp.]
MTAAFAAGFGVASPQETWDALATAQDALLVDVRTRAEWAFVGSPDLEGAAGRMARIEWTTFPTMAPNPAFAEDVEAAVAASGARTVYFMCRSGARSAAAAAAMSERFAAAGRDIACVNVAEGFEGDLGPDGKRGVVNGWKARGLPWRQS